MDANDNPSDTNSDAGAADRFPHIQFNAHCERCGKEINDISEADFFELFVKQRAKGDQAQFLSILTEDRRIWRVDFMYRAKTGCLFCLPQQRLRQIGFHMMRKEKA